MSYGSYTGTIISMTDAAIDTLLASSAAASNHELLRCLAVERHKRREKHKPSAQTAIQADGPGGGGPTHGPDRGPWTGL